jgi:hypothetical protein
MIFNRLNPKHKLIIIHMMVHVQVVHFGSETSVGIEYDDNGEWKFKPIW